MSGETTLTVVGNLTADPELRYTQSGLAVASFTIASTPRVFDKAKGEYVDGEALFLRASCWREFAEHVACSSPRPTLGGGGVMSAFSEVSKFIYTEGLVA